MRQLLSGVGAQRHSVRVRLTVLLGALFVVSGAALLGATYLLVERATGEPTVVETQTASPSPPASSEIPWPVAAAVDENRGRPG